MGFLLPEAVWCALLSVLCVRAQSRGPLCERMCVLVEISVWEKVR